MSEVNAGERLKVFISYSRRDSSNFADELFAGLELAGFAPFLDRHDIAAGEDWEARLGGLIREADTVIYVVSEEAVKSERCGWEVDKAVSLSKRLLPVIFKPVPEIDIPQQLRRLQFVRFDTGLGFAHQLTQLAVALRQDLDWVREHTRLGELAMRWQARGKPESLLLRGDDLNAAKAWVAKRRAEAPEITQLQRGLLDASEKAEAAGIAASKATRGRARRSQAIIGVLLFATASGLAYSIWSNQSYLMLRAGAFSELVWSRVLTASAESSLKPKDSFKECARCPEMVFVPAGEFMMGSPTTEPGHFENESPQHKVVISKAFAVSRFKVTFDDWDACVMLGGCAIEPSDSGWGRGTRPVMFVNWDDAQQYVAWLSKRTGRAYRLLTEAEWEYAARAGSTTAYYWGDQIGTGNADCNGCGSKWDNTQTSPVGSFAANRFGLYDMLGDVFDWVEDCYHDNYNGAPPDGSGWTASADCDHRVNRGGAWANPPEALRAALRNWNATRDRDHAIGFRVGRTLIR